MPPNLDRGVDLGSGAGFPGLILALVSGVPFDLIEANKRKAAFLREAAWITGAPVQVHAVRIESANIAPARLVTARALAPLSRLLGLAALRLRPGGVCLLLKGAGVEAELTHATPEWHMRVERIPSRTNAAGCILRISQLARAAPKGC
jgi:16S rRNA (guanine527-N7)-methyltransferase